VDGAGLSDENWLAYRHYLQCKATWRFPDDPIVARNAGLIRWVEDSVERNHTSTAGIMLGMLATARRGK
jgi:hypothetical protein